MSNFTHLHVHTQYSILDGLSSISELIEKAYNDGQRAMAVTDHGNMYGIYTFLKEVEKFNKSKAKANDPFKGIIGCEVYVARRGNRFEPRSAREDHSGYHLILLAKNMVGYKNLSHLVSLGWTEGYYYTPRVDKEILRKYSEGIICCSACLGGELPQVIMAHNPSLYDGTLPIKFDLTEASKVVEEFKSIYGRDYYLELQRNGHKEQHLVNEALLQLAEKHNVKCIATNDVHFVNKEDFNAHKMLICINTRKEFILTDNVASDSDSDNGMFYSGEEYFRTTAEMEELFADHPEVIQNTQLIADKIDVFSLAHKPTLPRFSVPARFKNEFDYLTYLTWEGAKRRWGENLSDEIKERLQFELDTVGKMGYPGYFLIVNDFIEAGRKNGIRFGPGRGSAAGSAIAYCLNITNIDPIKYDLLFERFLNPDRISLPDMDIDMDSTGRAKTIQYVSEKYGKEKVAVIVTLMEMKGKTAIRDCARAIGLSLAESDRLAKMMPDDPKLKLSKAIAESPELQKELQSSDPRIRQTLEYASRLDGTIRGTGVHACGVIIGRDDLFDCIPLATSKNSDTMVTQYEGSLVEDAGLLKMDFLGLKTLDIITNTLANIKHSHNIDIDIDNIPLDDEKTYKLFQEGDTTAIFQFESDGMRKYLKELKPERFEDLIAMVSLYRPGPMDNIPSFIARKNGREPIKYLIPEMGKILDETYGITIYQEQVMLLSRLLADFTRGDADTLRKAMGKKKLDVMEEMKTKFIYGATQKDYRKEDLDIIWEEWTKFASYAFNKSHATCYAYVSYQTAWLKANYTAEFLAANLTLEIADMKKVTELIEEANQQGIAVLPPDINESGLDFTVDKTGSIRFGLSALKGVGTSAVVPIIEERDKRGPFTSIFDFMERIDLRACNRRVIENMASVGAFDSFGTMHRAQFFALDKEGKPFIEKLMLYGSRSQTEASQIQYSIFDEMPQTSASIALPPIPTCDPWTTMEQLKREKEIAGFFISGHPLDDFKPIIKCFSTKNLDLSILSDTSNWPQLLNRELCFVASVSNTQTGYTKNGKEYGKLFLEDYEGSIELPFWGQTYNKFKQFFNKGQFLFIRAAISERPYKRPDGGRDLDLNPLEIMDIHDVYTRLCRSIHLEIHIHDLSENLANILNDIITTSNTKAKKDKIQSAPIPLIFDIKEENGKFSSAFHNFQMKVFPEYFIDALPTNFPAEIVLQK